jgi:hypothetical protein
VKKKQLLEFTPLTIFLTSGFGHFFKIPGSNYVLLISGSFLACLYFYVSFWLYAGYAISLLNKIVAGVAFSITIIAGMFCFLNWPLWRMFGIAGYAGITIILLLCLFNQKKAAYKQFLYRSVFFLVVLAMVFGYRLFGLR